MNVIKRFKLGALVAPFQYARHRACTKTLMSRIGNQATAGRRPAATPILTREIHGYGLYYIFLSGMCLIIFPLTVGLIFDL